MTRYWVAVALLALSWLLGVDLLAPAHPLAAVVAVCGGVLLLAEAPRRDLSRREAAAAGLMLLAAATFWPWPYRGGLLLAGLGLIPAATGLQRPRWPRALAAGALRAGFVLIAQSAALWAYLRLTARTHDLPGPLAAAVGTLARALGIDAAVDGATVALGNLAGPQRLGATWELVLDPATVAFWAGGAVLLALVAWQAAAGPRRWAQRLGLLTLAVAAWLPVRTALVIALLMHRQLRATDAWQRLLMNQFFSPWVLGTLLAGAVVLAARFTGRPLTALPPPDSPPQRPRRTYGLVPAMIFLAAAMVAWAVYWDPIGSAKPGRVVVVERHSTWEPTDRAYDTESYGEDPSYSYSGIYRYLGQYFQTSRLAEADAIDDAALDRCDVLVVKTPTQPYEAPEIAAIERFVEDGGGLLLIGEHTDVMKTGTYLNRLADRFGFKFRPDLLFRVGSPYDQTVEPARVPHPAVQHVPRMDYAVSCSIDPGWSLGRAPVIGTGLWNLPPDYNADNFFPQAEYRPSMRYGAFVQLWATRHGKGRVMAFTDSTIFSNFSTFEPGKAELMRGMVDWLNHSSVFDRGWPRGFALLVLLGLAAGASVAAGVVFRRGGTGWLPGVAAGLLGWTVAAVCVAAYQRAAMPPPPLRRPLVRVVLDRTVSEVPLSHGGFTDDHPLGYGLVEQWIPRLGYYTVRAAGEEAFSGDLLLVISPTRSVSSRFRRRLVAYVEGGGRLLVFDSPDSVGTTANSLLWPFDMAVYHATSAQGKLTVGDGWPGLDLEATCEVVGGEPMMWVGDTAVAARKRVGRGEVIAVGFGSLMNNANMGLHWMRQPTQRQRQVYDVLFALVRAAAEGAPLAAKPRSAAKRKLGNE